jgi:hypothetical protein
MNRIDRIEPKALAPPLTEARLARQYAAVRLGVGRSLGARPRSGRTWAAVFGGAVAAAAAVVLVVFARRGPVAAPGLVDGALLESAAEGVRVSLVDGSRVDLAAHTRARLTSARATAIRIDLETGRVEVDATHIEGRAFVVGAGACDVHVVGTHFVVERAPGERVSVGVDRGVVEVTTASGDKRRVGAGERWSTQDGPVAASSPQAESTVPPRPSPQAVAPSPPAPEPAPATPETETAKQLLDEAQRARFEGRPQDAARALDRLRKTFRRDRRASLAAFELGKLRLETLGDPRGAEEAFRDAIALGPSSPFREDAEARRVEAFSRMGDTAGCADARDAYLARWPAGTYRRTVEVYCTGR